MPKSPNVTQLKADHRYDWADGKWVYSRDNSTLGDLLRQETRDLITDPAGHPPLELSELK
jgi:frataxin-like iron-binding protein CyaY